jgi:hypothetical protein
MAANWQYGFAEGPQNITTGSGSGPYTQTVTFFPILPVAGGTTVQIKVSGTLCGQDDGNGNLVGAGAGTPQVTTGTVNYVTGAISVTFASTPGATPTVTYNASSINTTPSNNDDAIFNFKQVMKAAGWTVPSSSDGTTYNSSGDQITVRGTGAGAFGNTSAWFRLKAPTGTRELLFHRNATSGTTVPLAIARSNLGFTGGSPSSSVTATATDQFQIYGATGTYAGGLNTQTHIDWSGGQATSGYHNNCAADANAPYGAYSFSFTKSPVAQSALFNAMVIDSLAAGSYLSNETDPYWYYFNAVASSLVTPTAANCNGSTAGIINNNIIPLPWPSNFGANPFTGKDDLFPQYYYGNVSATPITYKGQSYYYKANSFTTGSRLPGTLLDVSSLNDTVMANVWCFPWNGLAILLG